MRYRQSLSITPLLFALGAAIALAGCGGGGSSSSEFGRASVTIEWPTESRLIPLAAKSIKIEMKRGTEVFVSKTIARPSSGGTATVLFDRLPVGALTAIATAFPLAGAAGTPQATGTTPLTVEAGKVASFTVTMNSTIDHLELAPTAPSVAVGATVAFTMTAKDAAGSVVLTAPSKLTWTSDKTGRATVDTNGVAKGVAPTGITPGAAIITVKDTESGKTASAPLIVTSSAVVTVSPNPTNVAIGDKKTFTAAVTGAGTATTVTWSVVEGATGGTITGAGVYTAPDVVGTYHIKAISDYDTSKSGEATVNVQSGGTSVIVK